MRPPPAATVAPPPPGDGAGEKGKRIQEVDGTLLGEMGTFTLKNHRRFGYQVKSIFFLLTFFSRKKIIGLLERQIYGPKLFINFTTETNRVRVLH